MTLTQSDPSTVIHNADGSFTAPAGYTGKLPEIVNDDPDAVDLDTGPNDGPTITTPIEGAPI